MPTLFDFVAMSTWDQLLLVAGCCPMLFFLLLQLCTRAGRCYGSAVE
jgi:hypothetical protein